MHAGMASLTIRADDDLLDSLEDEAEERGVSRAQHVREILRDRHGDADRVAALERKLDECKARADELETECERVRREKRQLLDQREEHQELVAAVQREQSLAERRARAGLWTKLKWSIRGMPDDPDE